MPFTLIKTKTQIGSLITVSHVGPRLSLMSGFQVQFSPHHPKDLFHRSPQANLNALCVLQGKADSWPGNDSGDQGTILLYFGLILVACLYVEKSTQGPGWNGPAFETPDQKKPSRAPIIKDPETASRVPGWKKLWQMSPGTWLSSFNIPAAHSRYFLECNSLISFNHSNCTVKF